MPKLSKKFKTLFAPLTICMIMVSCGGGGSNATVSGGSSIPNSPQVVNVDISNTTQYATPNFITNYSSNSSTLLKSSAITDNDCISVSNLNFNSSSSKWYVSGEFSLLNKCPQAVSGVQLVLTGGGKNDVWNGGAFNINSINPWVGSSPDYTTKTTGNNLASNQILVTINNTFPANQQEVVDFGYLANGFPLTLSGATIKLANAPTPPPPPSNLATVILNLNSAALGNNNMCNSASPCNIPLNLVDANNKVYKNITSITDTTGANLQYVLESVPLGSYHVTAENLPNKVVVNFNPLELNLVSGQVQNVAAIFSISNPTNPCLSATAQPSSVSDWWVNANITISNDCPTAQDLSGSSLVLSSDNSADSFDNIQINSVYQDKTWIANANFGTFSYVNNLPQLNISNNFSIPATSSVIVNVAYGPHGTGLMGSLIATVDGQTPLNKATLDVLVDSSKIAAYCNTQTQCNIPVVLSGQDGKFNKTITTITKASDTTIYHIANLNPGSYSVSTNNLPAKFVANYYPSSQVNLAASESKAITLALDVKPTGSLQFGLLNPDSNLFQLESTIVNIVPTDGSASTSVGALFNSVTKVSLANGDYTVSTIGFASASQGAYYRFQPKEVKVSLNHTSDLGNLIAEKQQSLVSQSFQVNGLESNDSIKIQFTDNGNYLFNAEQINATNPSSQYQFIVNSDITVNVLVNDRYDFVTPFTFHVDNVSKKYVINLTKRSSTQQIVGYFETWMAQGTNDPATFSIAAMPSYVKYMPLAFAKPDSSYEEGSYDFNKAGFGISARKDVALGAIAIAQAKGQKLLLSVGGATYPNFKQFNLAATMALVKDLNLDGVDLDYEANTSGCQNLNSNNLSCPTDSEIIDIVTQLRKGLDDLETSLHKHLYLTAAVWSIGGYGSVNFPSSCAAADKPDSKRYEPCGAKAALWVNPLKQVGNKFDMLFLMSYDAGKYFDSYNPIDALKSYQALYSGPIYLGLEVPPEAWGGNVTTPNQWLDLAKQAEQLKAAGTMVWALQVQGTANGQAVNARSYLEPLCIYYNPLAPDGFCQQNIPLN